MARWRITSCCVAWVCGISALGALSGTAEELGAPAQTRLGAETLAIWGYENGADLALLAGLSGLLAAGVSLEPDDPWRARRYVETLQQNFATDAQLLSQLSRQLARPRGVFDGISRIDAVLEPGEQLTVAVEMAQGETALVEARVKSDGTGADVDLEVRTLSGDLLASDIGPDTGIEGTGTLALWRPQGCETVEIIVTNAAQVPARVVMMAPPSQQETCDTAD